MAGFWGVSRAIEPLDSNGTVLDCFGLLWTVLDSFGQLLCSICARHECFGMKN